MKKGKETQNSVLKQFHKDCAFIDKNQEIWKERYPDKKCVAVFKEKLIAVCTSWHEVEEQIKKLVSEGSIPSTAMPAIRCIRHSKMYGW